MRSSAAESDVPPPGRACMASDLGGEERPGPGGCRRMSRAWRITAAGSREVTDGDVGPPHLDEGAHGRHRERVGEQRPEACGPRQQRLGSLPRRLGAPPREPPRRTPPRCSSTRRRCRRPRAPSASSAVRAASVQSPRSAAMPPRSTRVERGLRVGLERHGDVQRRARAPRRPRRRGPPAGGPRPPRSSMPDRKGLVGAEPGVRRSERRRPSPRCRPGTGRRVGTPASASIVLPSGSGGPSDVTAEHRHPPTAPPRPAVPASVYIRAPLSGERRVDARAGSRRRATGASACTVSDRPLAQTGWISWPMRATARSMSPAACACSSALSAMPFASYQAAARPWSSGTRAGSLRPSSARSRSRKSWWRRYQLVRRGRRGGGRGSGRSICSSHRAESVRLEHRIAQRRAQSVEHRRAGEERDLLGAAGGRAPRSGSTRPGTDGCRAVPPAAAGAGPRLHGEGRQVQTGRPALRPGGQLLDVGRQQLDPAVAEQLGGLLGIEGQVVDPELVQTAVGAQPGGGPAGRGRGRRRAAVLRGELERDLGDDVEGLGVRDRLGVVDGEGERLAVVVDPREQASHDGLDGPMGLDARPPPRSGGCRRGRGRPRRRRAARRDRCRARQRSPTPRGGRPL